MRFLIILGAREEGRHSNKMGWVHEEPGRVLLGSSFQRKVPGRKPLGWGEGFTSGLLEGKESRVWLLCVTFGETPGANPDSDSAGLGSQVKLTLGVRVGTTAVGSPWLGRTASSSKVGFE